MRILIACVIGLIASPALAQNCAPRERVTERLANQFGESRQAAGLTSNNGNLMEVYASDESGTWTITVTLPNGLTCLIGSGQSFETLNEEIAMGDPT